MPLSGLERISTKPRGGVVSVRLTPASEFSAQTDIAGSEWVFREDRADYTEENVDEGPRPIVRRTLKMELPATEVTRGALNELLAMAGGGFVAQVTLASGEELLVGYSECFGASYPLRVAKVATASGYVPGDFPATILTLECIDA